MDPLLPGFNEIYVVSDIHLGGQRDREVNFQIFDRGKRLASFIRHVSKQRSEEDVALVLNGDVIDSLAEETIPGYIAMSTNEATSMMDHLYTDPSFAPVWNALGDFVALPGRHLAFVIGNHDIELHLPVVQRSIKNRLTDFDAKAAARITFATHGGGFACRVGRAHVFCTHGNEVDPWNHVDYDLLGQLANAMNAGRSVLPARWKPNGGTRLVVDVLNSVKKRFPFLDTLKPEGAAVAGELMVLDRELFREIDLTDAFPIIRAGRRGARITQDLLGGYEPPEVEDVDPLDAGMGLLAPSVIKAIEDEHGWDRAALEDDLLLGASRAIREPERPIVSDPEAPPETLKWIELVAGRLGLLSREEGLRLALKD
jgi:UDP-2,3-diacylglucosamine pyrophosphatase LpxH